jgi:molybdate-binding protein
MSRDPDILNMESQNVISIVGWPRNSELSRIFQAALRDAGIDPGVVRFAGVVRTHYAVAVAVACRWAQLGFGTRMAAEKAGLCFRKMAIDRIDILTVKSGLEDERIKTIVSGLGSRGR